MVSNWKGNWLDNTSERGNSDTYAKVLEQVLGLAIDIELPALGVLGEVESRNLGDVLILALSLLFLQLKGDTTNGATLDTLHPKDSESY
jgi:hypothetical protein